MIGKYINTIICGDCLEVMKDWPAGSVNCCISSPPYWALRDYGVAGQLGLEKTFEEYIDKLCTIYDEVKRVLRPDGTCWVNLGDTYAAQDAYGGCFTKGLHEGISQETQNNLREQVNRSRKALMKQGIIKPKSLCLIPQRFAIEMVNRGWILRNTIIWHKPNPMPSSAKDRFTVDFEYVYFFVKNKKYWFEPQYEPQTGTAHSKGNKLHPPIEDAGVGHKDWHKYTPLTEMPLGRNKRTVWTIPTQPFPEAHFATYPEKLVEPMIKAGCPEFICKKCGKAREKIYEPTIKIERTETYNGKQQGQDKQFSHKRIQMLVKAGREAGLPHDNTVVPKLFKGYTDCGCNAGWRPGIVFDPFAVRARPVKSLPGIEGTGLVLSLNRNISRWRCAA